MDISKLSKCGADIADDSLNFGIACTKKLLDIHEIVVEYPTDIARLKEDALASMHTTDGTARANADILVFTNANLLTMDSGDLQADVLRNAVLFTRNGRIEAIGGAEDIVIPEGAMLIDVEGGRITTCEIVLFITYSWSGYITPGFIDVHAHWFGFAGIYPARSWELQTFLAYGVTTLHKYVYHLALP